MHRLLLLSSCSCHVLLVLLQLHLLLLCHSQLLLLHLLLHCKLLRLHIGLVVHHLLSTVTGVLAIICLLVTVAFLFGLLNRSKLLAPREEVGFLRLLDKSVDAIDLKLVGMDLGLVVLELSNQVPQLLATILQILLILYELLGDIRSTLLRQNILQLDVEFFFLLDEHVLLRNFLRLCNQALLEALNLLDQFVRLDASRLKLTPPVHIKRLFELVLKVLGLLLLLE